MGKFIRGNQLDKYNRYEEEIARLNKKRKIKKFRDTEKQKNKLIKRD